MKKILDYLLVGIEDDNGQFSGKRALGSFCILVGLGLTAHASMLCLDKLAEQTMLIAPVFATGLAFWGLTSWQTIQTNKQISNENITNTAIEEDADNPKIEIKQ